MMKRVLFCSMLLIAMLHNLAMSEERDLDGVLFEEIESKTLRPFFNALKNGNVELIKHLFSSEMYEEYRLLLDENGDYPDFLREYYRDAVFSVERGMRIDNRVVVDFSIQFPGKGRQTSQFVLQVQDQGRESDSRERVAGERRWQISEQRNDQAD